MEQILTIVGHYGYAGIFVLLMLGIFGVPVPDETLLMFSGFMVSKGELRLPYAIFFATLGSMSGISISYLVGRLGGFYLVKKYGPRVHITEERLEKARSFFDRSGRWSLIIGYYLPGIRHLTAIVAGSTRMRYLHFAAFAYVGAALWTSTFIMTGFYFGEKWQTIAKKIHGHLVLASIIAFSAAVIIALIIILRRRALQAK